MQYLIFLVRILLYAKDVRLAISENSVAAFKGEKKGEIYLTSHRVSNLLSSLELSLLSVFLGDSLEFVVSVRLVGVFVNL